MVKDKLREPLMKLLNEYAARAGTDIAGAIRDVYTELCHICDARNLNYSERFESGEEVYKDERAEELDEPDDDDESNRMDPDFHPMS